MPVTLSIEDYTTLAGWAESYGLEHHLYNAIKDKLERIEAANDLVRNTLMVRWRAGQERITGHLEPDWPYLQSITLSRYGNPWTYDDVISAVQARTTHPFGIEVTGDRTGQAGWTSVDTWFNR